MKKTNCLWPTVEISTERLAAANVSVELHQDSGMLIFTDRSEQTCPIFSDECVTDLVNQFGEQRTDSMLDEAAHVIRREKMAEKIRRAMCD
jgi:hypothetical protein